MDLTEPTDALPGSSAKLEIIRARAEADLPIFIPGDSTKTVLQQPHGHYAFRFDPEAVYRAAVEARAVKLETIRKALQA